MWFFIANISLYIGTLAYREYRFLSRSWQLRTHTYAYTDTFAYVYHQNSFYISQMCRFLKLTCDMPTVYPKKYAHGFGFAVLCCGNTLTDFPIAIRLTSLALRQSNDCPSASKVILMNMDKYFMWIHYERLCKHNKAKHKKTCAYFLGYTVDASFKAPIHAVIWCLCGWPKFILVVAVSYPGSEMLH